MQFVINPLLLQGLGSSLYGAWRVLYSLNGYLWATAGRSAQVLTWVIAHGQRTLSEDEKRRYVGSAVIVWFIFLPLLLIVGGVGSWFAPFFLETPPESVWDVRIAATLLTVDAIALTLLSIPRSTLQGENLGYKRMGLSAIMIILNGALMMLAIHWNTGIVGVAAANIAGTIVTGLLFWQVARKYVPWFGVARPSRSNVRWILGLSGWFTGWKFVYELMTAGDVIVLGIFGSVELVAVYTLTKFVSSSPYPPHRGRLRGHGAGIGSDNRQRRTPRGLPVSEVKSWHLPGCFQQYSARLCLLWNRSFVDQWVGPHFYAGAVPMLLIVVMVVQFIFVTNDARIIDLDPESPREGHTWCRFGLSFGCVGRVPRRHHRQSHRRHVHRDDRGASGPQHCLSVAARPRPRTPLVRSASRPAETRGHDGLLVRLGDVARRAGFRRQLACIDRRGRDYRARSGARGQHAGLIGGSASCPHQSHAEDSKGETA